MGSFAAKLSTRYELESDEMSYEGNIYDPSVGLQNGSTPVLPPPLPSAPQNQDASGDEEDNEPPFPLGMKCGIHNLYSGKEDKNGNFHWTQKKPVGLEEAAEGRKTAKWAVIARHVRVYCDARKVLKLHSFVVQSPILKQILGVALDDYPGVGSTDIERLEFGGRFEAIIHRWPQIQELMVKTVTEEETQHAQNFLQFIKDSDLHEVLEEANEARSTGQVSFHMAWTLFKPTDLIFTRLDGQEIVSELLRGTYNKDKHGNHFLRLETRQTDYDGHQFGFKNESVVVEAWEGKKAIRELRAHPLSCHEDEADVRLRLTARGSKVESLCGYHFKAYNGVAWYLDGNGRKVRKNLNSRIVIDTASWNRFNTSSAILVVPFGTAKAQPKMPSLGKAPSWLPPPPPLGQIRGPKLLSRFDSYEMYAGGNVPLDGYFPDDNSEEPEKRPPLSDEQKLMCSPLVRGFDMKSKMWYNFFVNCVHEIAWNDRAFDSLVLPENHKELLLGFTEGQQKLSNRFDDAVIGKGKGFIVLLSGGAGVGKTMTAESLAENMRVPLYILAAGDLGHDALFVEIRLENAMELSSKWKALLLVDEADVFLEQRSLHELERNKLVSIFLRKLEYFEGIMFLTTNRVETFDQAFQSRIHVSLNYPPLTAEYRYKIWNNFLTKGDGIQNTLTARQMERLSLFEINGRQIKNVLKTALLLAGRRSQSLGFDHIKTVLDVTQFLLASSSETDRQRGAIYG